MRRIEAESATITSPGEAGKRSSSSWRGVGGVGGVTLKRMAVCCVEVKVRKARGVGREVGCGGQGFSSG